MTMLVAGLVLFIGTHVFTTLRAPRARLIARIGEGAYKTMYAVASVAGIVLIAYGFGRYRAGGMIPLWDPPLWTRHLTLTLMLIASILLVSAYVPGHIRAALKHPMLAAVKIWALAHLIANGDLGSVILFGSLLAWAVYDRIAVKKRERIEGAPPRRASWRNDVVAVLLGIVVYGAFAFTLHPLLIGVPVM